MWMLSLFAALNSWRRFRKNVRALAALDDHMLQDIGMNRTEVASRAWEQSRILTVR
jgi:uncharacterized protein YjiS (DUF1127 family)